MTKVYSILTSCLILVHCLAFAQEPTQSYRLELDLSSENTTVKVDTLPDSSLLLYTKVSKFWNDGIFEFTKYDHQLKQVWRVSEKLEPQSEYIYQYSEAPYTYIAFSKPDPQEYTFLRIHLATGQTRLENYTFKNIDALFEFRVLKGQYFIIGQDRKNYRPVLFHLKPTDGSISLLPSVYGDESFFSDLLADPGQNRADAVLLESNGRASHLQIKSFNPNGNLIGTYFTPPLRDKLLQKAQLSKGDTLSKMLVGVYGTNSVEQAVGFYTMPLLHEYKEGRFYSLLDLKNSLSHLKARQEKRIRNKEQNRLSRRKPSQLKSKMLLHNLIPTAYGYVLAAEVYTSKFENRQNARITFPDLPLNSREESYKHTQVLVVAFNKNGELLWDNSFKLDDIITDELVPTVEVLAAPDGRVIVALPDEDEVLYRVMDKGNYIKEETTLTLKGQQEGDRIANTLTHGIISWHDSSFAAFGFHRVRPKEGESRSVFYINKITF